MAIAILFAAACSGSDAVLVGNGINALSGAVDPQVLRGLDGILGWKRTGDPERYRKETLYGYIDGGAEIVLEYGFRELSVSKYKPENEPGSAKEIVLEIYRMSSPEAAFGFYSSKLEGDERGWPGVAPDNWISPGQANLVKGEFLANILAPECADQEIGEFMRGLEPKIPGRGTVRPKGFCRLPRTGMIPSSWHYLKGPLAAREESPFLEGAFWGFGGAASGGGTEAFSAKYGATPAVSQLVVVVLGKTVAPGAVDEGVLASFTEYLKDVKREGPRIEGRNEAGRWFLYKRAGAMVALVLGERDEAAGRARLDEALAPGSAGPGRYSRKAAVMAK